MKYPTLLKRMNWRDTPDLQNKRFEVNTEWIANEENVAGFTYEDFLTETDNNTYDSWTSLELGQLVEGKVVSTKKDGAYVQINGAKTWAFLPTKNCSLQPIGNVKAVLSVGDEITAKVVALDATSQMASDPEAKQLI